LFFATVVNSVYAWLLGLTPIERWGAAREFKSPGFFSGTWFIVTGLLIVVVLSVILLFTSYGRRITEKRRYKRLFFDYADRRGLSEDEQALLGKIAERAGLKRRESIFTISSAFDRGATDLIEESFSGENFEEGKQLRSQIAFIREKLGFLRRNPISIASISSNKTVSSRQISTGKKLYIARRGDRAFRDIESIVIRSDDSEITVQLNERLDLSPGDILCAHYYFGISVWEFDTSVVHNEGGVVVLTHSDNVRFINRRRFLRVAVSKSAFIAHFPFRKLFTVRNLNPTAISQKNQIGAGGKSAAKGAGEQTDEFWGVPEFVPGVVTELAGPGIRIKTLLELEVGERVLVILKLNQIKEAGPDSEMAEEIKTLEVVEDVGEIKHITAVEDGFSIAVELVGLTDSNVNELVRATNSASVENDKQVQSSQESSDDKSESQKAASLRSE